MCVAYYFPESVRLRRALPPCLLPSADAAAEAPRVTPQAPTPAQPRPDMPPVQHRNHHLPAHRIHDTPGLVDILFPFFRFALDSGLHLCYNGCTEKALQKTRILPDYGIPFYTIDLCLSMVFFVSCHLFIAISSIFPAAAPYTRSVMARIALSYLTASRPIKKRQAPPCLPFLLFGLIVLSVRSALREVPSPVAGTDWR